MRIRNLALILAVFGAAAGAAAFVVSQFPREGDVSPLRAAPLAAAPAELSPPLPPAGAGDGVVEVRVTAGPEPLASAEVRLYAAPDAAGAPWRRAGEGRTDRTGTARIPARPGAYLAAARAPGLAPARGEVVRPAGDGAARLDLVLEPPAVLEGSATGPGGGPVAGARVRLVPLVTRWPGFAPPSAPPEETAELRTDAAGAFRAAGLTPGSWALALDATGYHPVSLPRLPVPGPAVAVSLEPLGTLEGVALLADGRPAAGATVRAVSAAHGATATSAADGRFRLAVPAGSYAVLAVLGERGGAAAAPVAVAAGAISHAEPFRLGAAAAVEGLVTRGARAPAAGAEVVLLAHGTREVVARTVTGPGGGFALAPLAPAAYDLAAAAPETSPALLEGVTVTAGQRFTTRLALPGTGAVVGTVRDASGHSLVGVRVRATGRAGGVPSRPPVETRTDFEGRFRLAPLEVGRVEVVAREDPLPLGVARATVVAEGRDVSVDLALPASGVLAGRVSDGGRPPPRGTAVLVSPLRAGEGALQLARAAVDASGNFELPLPAGEYRVHAAPGSAPGADLRVAPTFARVEPGRTSRVELSAAPVPREAGVEILVLEPGGAPSPGATVTLARPDDGRVALATEAGDDGRVRVDARMGMSGRPVTIRGRNGGRAGQTTVSLPEAGTVAVHLAPGGAVAGLVRGARAGFTLEVSSQPASGSWRTLEVHRFTGERFTLGDLPAEPLRLVARADDGRRGAAEVRIAPGETRSVELTLR
jgi:hypothetical protein